MPAISPEVKTSSIGQSKIQSSTFVVQANGSAKDAYFKFISIDIKESHAFFITLLLEVFKINYRSIYTKQLSSITYSFKVIYIRN